MTQCDLVVALSERVDPLSRAASTFVYFGASRLSSPSCWSRYPSTLTSAVLH